MKFSHSWKMSDALDRMPSDFGGNAPPSFHCSARWHRSPEVVF